MDDPMYLREDQWQRIKELLPSKAGDVGRTGDKPTRYRGRDVDGAYSGTPLRSCPAYMGDGLMSINVSDGGRRWESGK